MVKKNYHLGFALGDKKTARAVAKNAPLSVKYANEIISKIKGKPLQNAMRFLENVVSHKEFLPIKVYNNNVAHRKGEAKSGVKSGRYPEKACKIVLGLLESVKANADYKGLDEEKLIIVHAFASYGYGRMSHQSQGKIGGKPHRRHSTHFEVVVRETA